MSNKENMYLFYGAHDPLSNWHMRQFTVKHMTFCCMEQAMMYCKAMLFGDLEIAGKIMATVHPARMKALGRQVRKFNGAIWEAKREDYVYICKLAQFRQNPDMADFLIATGTKMLVEASPTDNIWGAGLDAGSPAIWHPKLWLGLNLLGKVCERVRDTLNQDRGLPC